MALIFGLNTGVSAPRLRGMKNDKFPKDNDINPTVVAERPLFSLKQKEKSQAYFTLTVVEGNNFGELYQLSKAQTVIGRKAGEGNNEEVADIQIDDPKASRRHIVLLQQQDPSTQETYINVIDLGSKNGSTLNDKILTEETRLNTGDKLQIGNTILKFEVKDQADLKYHEKLYQQVTRDELTGLWNHNHARQQIEKLISTKSQTNGTFSLFLAEVDFLQTLNETYSRKVGDDILKAVGQIANESLGDTYTVARFASKQYLVLMPELGIDTASEIAEKFRQEVEESDFSALGCPQTVTISIGVVEFPTSGKTIDELANQADQVLYQIKQVGRNQVVKAAPLVTTASPQLKRIAVGVLLGLALITLISLGIIYFPKLNVKQDSLTFSGLIEAQEVVVGSKVGGRVTKLLVEEGDTVKTDQALMEIDVKDLVLQKRLLETKVVQAEANLAKLEAGTRPEEINQAEAESRKQLAALKSMQNGNRPEEISQAKIQLSTAKVSLANTTAIFERFKELYKNGLTSKQLYEEAETNASAAANEVEVLQQKLQLLESGNRVEDIEFAQENFNQAQAKVKLLKAGTRKEEIQEMRAKIDEIKVSIEQIDLQLTEGQIRASVDGIIELINVNVGDIIPPNKPVVKLLDPEQVFVRIYVPEPQLGYLKVGQAVDILIDTFEEKTFPGYIKQIAGRGEFLPRNVQTREQREYQVFAVKIAIKNKDGKLKPGMTTEVKFKVDN